MLDQLQRMFKKDELQEYVNSVCDLIINHSVSYTDILGEEVEIEFEKKWLRKLIGIIKIRRKGMPIAAYVILLKYLNEQKKEESRRAKRMKKK